MVSRFFQGFSTIGAGRFIALLTLNLNVLAIRHNYHTDVYWKATQTLSMSVVVTAGSDSEVEDFVASCKADRTWQKLMRRAFWLEFGPEIPRNSDTFPLDRSYTGDYIIQRVDVDVTGLETLEGNTKGGTLTFTFDYVWYTGDQYVNDTSLAEVVSRMKSDLLIAESTIGPYLHYNYADYNGNGTILDPLSFTIQQAFLDAAEQSDNIDSSIASTMNLYYLSFALDYAENEAWGGNQGLNKTGLATGLEMAKTGVYGEHGKLCDAGCALRNLTVELRDDLYELNKEVQNSLAVFKDDLSDTIQGYTFEPPTSNKRDGEEYQVTEQTITNTIDYEPGSLNGGAGGETTLTGGTSTATGETTSKTGETATTGVKSNTAKAQSSGKEDEDSNDILFYSCVVGLGAIAAVALAVVFYFVYVKKVLVNRKRAGVLPEHSLNETPVSVEKAEKNNVDEEGGKSVEDADVTQDSEDVTVNSKGNGGAKFARRWTTNFNKQINLEKMANSAVDLVKKGGRQAARVHPGPAPPESTDDSSSTFTSTNTDSTLTTST